MLLFLGVHTCSGESGVVLLYSRHCQGSIEWAKYLHKLFTELSKHKGRMRYVGEEEDVLKILD